MLASLLFFISILSVGAWFVFYFKLGSGLRFIALAYGFGTALISLELFLYFVIFRLSFSPLIYWFFGLQTLVALFLVFKKINWRHRLLISWQKSYWFSLIIVLVVACFLIINFVQAIARPVLPYDGIAFWSIRAEMMIVDKAVNFNPESANYLSSFSHRNYPWHFSLLEYWLRLLGGTGGWLNLISWGYFVSLVFLIISVARRCLGNWQGFLAGLFFVSMPFIFYHAANNYADLTLAYYSAVGFMFFIEWLISNNNKLLLFAAFFSGWAMFVKNEGVFCALALMAALLVTKFFKPVTIKWRQLFYSLLALIIPLAPWLIFKVIYKFSFSNTEGAIAFHPQIFNPLAQSLFVSNNWNIWWVIFIFSSIIMLKKIVFKRTLLPAWIMFGLMSAAIIAMYLFTEHYLWAMDHTALSRTFIPLVPMSMILLFISLQFYFSKSND